MAVGRKRARDRHLPRGVYRKHGAYYLVRYEGGRKVWRRLGADYAGALAELGRLASAESIAGTMAQLIARYQADEVVRRGKEAAAHARAVFKRPLTAFGAMSPGALQPHHVWNYWRERGETSMARHEIAALSRALTYGRRIGALNGPNPCFGLKLPGRGARTRYVTDEEFLLVRSVAPPMIAHAMNLALACGVDRSTILRLERRNITDAGIEFTRGKTGEFQRIEWTDELREIVRDILRERPQLRQALICNRHGRSYTPRGFGAIWQDTMARALKRGLAERFHFHDLRAKSASDSASDQEAADRLGHRDAALTRRVYRRLPRVAQPLKIVDRKGE